MFFVAVVPAAKGPWSGVPVKRLPSTAQARPYILLARSCARPRSASSVAATTFAAISATLGFFYSRFVVAGARLDMSAKDVIACCEETRGDAR